MSLTDHTVPTEVPVRAGWSRSAVPIRAGMRVLDVGSGAFPHPHASVLCDRDLDDNVHRAGLDVVIDRPLVRADASALPFRDGAFDYVICSHLAEHVEDPDALCGELARVSLAGYIETPSRIADVLLHEDYHLWRVGRSRSGALRFVEKARRPAWVAALTDPVYRIWNAAQPSCARPTYRLPDNLAGRVLAFGLRTVGGVLNRVGVMHTRVRFSPTKPLRWEVRGSVR